MNNVYGNYLDNQRHNGYNIASAQIHFSFNITSASEREDIVNHIREARTIPPSIAAQSISRVIIQPNASYVAPPIPDACYISATRSIIETRLMIDMVRTMINHPTLCPSASLPETLAALEQVLRLTELAVRAYHHTPLSESISCAVVIGVDDCRRILKELLGTLSDYRHMLSGVVLTFIRKYMWQRFGQGCVVDTIDLQLQRCHRSFAACLLALGR